MPIAAYPLIFNKQKVKGVNEDKWVTVRWQDDRITNNRMIYYGRVKNELRITRFGEKFPFLRKTMWVISSSLPSIPMKTILAMS